MLRLLATCFAALAFATSLHAQSRPDRTEALLLVDSARQRPVPVIMYRMVEKKADKAKLAIISHGYGGKYTDYSFIATTLVRLGYVVASIQHEVPGDEPIATTGNLRKTRRPNWERGVASIRFVAQTLRRTDPTIDGRQLLLVGHSNGGDMSMLFAATYPAEVANVISLDNRRMPLPRTKRPRLLSIRSIDQVADPDVLPTPTEQHTFGITVIQLPVLHNDMWDGATDQQKRAMTDAITRFLQ
ncbi:alpha/beta hydrolase [Fibrella sp. USSR17]